MEQQLAWLQGAYFKQALQSSVMICGLADRQVINKMPKYPDIPYKDEIEKSRAKNEEWVKMQRQRAFAHFANMLSAMGKKNK